MNATIQLFFTLALLLFSSQLIAQEWEHVKYDTIGFSISSPDLLVQNEQEAITELGKMKVISFGLSPKNDDNLLYQLIVISYPEGSIDEDSLDFKNALLLDLVDQSVSESNGELIYTEEIELQSRMGVQWRVHSESNLSIKSKALIDDNRVFIIQVMTRKEKSLNENINRFIDSFRFLE